MDKQKKTYIKPQILIEEWKVYKTTGSKRWGHRIYEVSNFGRVKINGVITEPKDQNGRKIISHFLVHRAVAELFIPNPENKPCVDHIDTNPSNNMVTNLRWVTYKENNNNPLTRQHISEAAKRRTLSEETKNKIGIACKKNWDNPEYRQMVTESHKKNWDNPEYRQKISDKRKDRPWIHKGKERKRPKINQLQSFLNDGWELGRK